MKRKFIIFCLIVLFIFTVFQNSSFAKVHSSAYRIVQDPAGVYVVEINTAKAKGRLIPYYSDELETNLDIYKKTNAKFAVNAGFFDPKNQKTVSYVVIDTLTVLDPKNNENLMKNKVLEPYFSKILNRTEFRILADSKGKLIYDIAPHDEAVKSGYTKMEGHGYIIKGGKSAVYSKVEESAELSASASGKATLSGAELGAGASYYHGKTNSVTDYKMNDDGICRAIELSADRGINPQLKIGASVKWGGDAKKANVKVGPVSLVAGTSIKSDGIKTTEAYSAKGSLLFSISGTRTKTTIDSNKINSSLNLNALDNQKI